MSPDKIQRYIRDFVALALGAGGFINEMLKDKPEAMLLILFFAMVLVPMPFAIHAMRTHGVTAPPDPPTPTPALPSGSPPPQPQPSSPPTS